MKRKRVQRKITIKSNGEELISLLHASGVFSGSKLILKQPGLTVFLLDDGTLLEIYGPGNVNPSYLFEKGMVVTSFKVEDLLNVVNNLVARGIAIPDGIQQVLPAYSYCYARFDNGLVIGFFQENNLIQ